MKSGILTAGLLAVVEDDATEASASTKSASRKATIEEDLPIGQSLVFASQPRALPPVDPPRPVSAMAHWLGLSGLTAPHSCLPRFVMCTGYEPSVVAMVFTMAAVHVL